jgi:hypothetical protein
MQLISKSFEVKGNKMACSIPYQYKNVSEVFLSSAGAKNPASP